MIFQKLLNVYCLCVKYKNYTQNLTKIPMNSLRFIDEMNKRKKSIYKIHTQNDQSFTKDITFSQWRKKNDKPKKNFNEYMLIWLKINVKWIQIFGWCNNNIKQKNTHTQTILLCQRKKRKS